MSPTDSAFHPTRWTLVLRSLGKDEDAKSALSDLCTAYYEPVVAFLRRSGRGPDDARETAHAFFERVLSQGIGAPDRLRGKFRNYLLGSLKHFLSKQREASLAEKRGGGMERVPLSSERESSPGLPIPGVMDDTLAFDSDWAFTLIARALAALEAEQAGRMEIFVTLKPWLSGAAEIPQAEAARALAISETAVKVAIHRLRVRFRELIRMEVAATVGDPEEVTEELRHLIAVASRK